MNLTLQKKLAAIVLKCSKKKIWCDPEGIKEIKESITKDDVRKAISAGSIRAKPKRGISQGRTRKQKIQKSKGLRKGAGSRKGKPTSREPKKVSWMKKIRLQRLFIKELKTKGYLTPTNYRMLYLKTKGGFFRSKRHIKLYLDEHKLAIPKK
ncbi:50S ribosomal protein L19e [Candidatus Woesearchaeota archaeon]|jgi:large subunit ribosomal protein L19e|nr:50S ribosomal protein L19e [Candidatus Woesearchaeota archaeon]